jgi:hypothetical protein
MEKQSIAVNNFEQLSKYFDILKSPEDFYYIQVIQRKKDGHRKSERIIRNFYIYTKEEFLNKKDYIIDLCKKYNARAYFWINPRNSRKIALECIKSYADLVNQRDCTKGYKVWDKKCGSNPASDYDTLWIVDVDTKDKGLLGILVDRINKCRAKYPDVTRDIVSTANGYHIITIGFDLHQFKQILIMEKIDALDVHKDNPTLLYYAENGRENL